MTVTCANAALQGPYEFRDEAVTEQPPYYPPGRQRKNRQLLAAPDQSQYSVTTAKRRPMSTGFPM